MRPGWATTGCCLASKEVSAHEYELDLLRQRSLAARHAKARRGELVVAAPVGFGKVGDRLEKDPDRRVQEAIRLIIDKVAEWGQCAPSPAVVPGAPTRPGNPAGQRRRSWKRPRYSTIYKVHRPPCLWRSVRLRQVTSFASGRVMNVPHPLSRCRRARL